MAVPRTRLWYGRDTMPMRRALRAGPLTALLDDADLRRIRIGAVEVAQRIYLAVRDEVWNTIPATYGDWDFDVADDHFEVRFSARHRYRDIDFSWRGRIAGTTDGVITYDMDGVAGSNFRYCKIGFNVHHPLHGSIGRAFQARTPGGPLDGVLPARIDPQRLVNGTLTGMFAPYDALEIEVRNGLRVRLDFEGDLFEMQDHRNWTDANFKSYGTPLAIPFPMDAHAGQSLRQRVALSVAGTAAPAAADTVVRLELGQPTGRHLPPIGTCVASHGGSLSDREADLLRVLRLDHLRVDLHLDRPGWEDELRRAASQAVALGAALELALFVGDETSEAITACAELLRSLSATPARVLVFQESGGRSPTAGSTPGSLVRRVRERLRPLLDGVPLAGGTKQFFAEINRDPPEVAAMDAVVFSINPQVHACDDTSLVENLEGQAEVVRWASDLCEGRPIIISPVTLIGREGPYAAGPPEPGGLPGNVDVRQASLFGAGWTACSARYLAESGAASLTYYETTGWLGLIETDGGPPRPALFPSHPGMVFPLYHVLADLAEWKGAEVVGLRSGDPLTVDGLALRAGGTMHLLIANLTAGPQALSIGPFAGHTLRLRLLDETNAELAMDDPVQFREADAVEVCKGPATFSHEGEHGDLPSPARLDSSAGATADYLQAVRLGPDGRLQLTLGPLAVARIDAVN